MGARRRDRGSARIAAGIVALSVTRSAAADEGWPSAAETVAPSRGRLHLRIFKRRRSRRGIHSLSARRTGGEQREPRPEVATGHQHALRRAAPLEGRGSVPRRGAERRQRAQCRGRSGRFCQRRDVSGRERHARHLPGADLLATDDRLGRVRRNRSRSAASTWRRAQHASSDVHRRQIRRRRHLRQQWLRTIRARSFSTGR